MQTTPLPALIAALAETINRDPGDLLDAFGSGEAVAVLNGAQNALMGFTYAVPLSRIGDRGLLCLRGYRVVTTVWTASDLTAGHADALSRQMLKELLGRLTPKTTLLAPAVAQLIEDCEMTRVADIDIRARYRLANALSLPRANGQEHKAANEHTIGIVRPTENDQILSVRVKTNPDTEVILGLRDF